MTNQPPKLTGVVPTKPSGDIHAFVASRDKAYDEAWLKTSKVMVFLGVDRSAIWATSFSYAWLMILNKLIRAMATPENKDHWLDIQGYCQLILEEQAKTK